MGYSCTARASFTLQAIEERFRAGEASNVLTTDGGKTVYFSERGRENSDGAVTGTVFLNLPDNMARRAGSYRIEPDGKITRFKGVPKKFWPELEAASEKRYTDTYNPVVREMLDSDTPRP